MPSAEPPIGVCSTPSPEDPRRCARRGGAGGKIGRPASAGATPTRLAFKNIPGLKKLGKPGTLKTSRPAFPWFPDVGHLAFP
jgi:hypothetical protein